MVKAANPYRYRGYWFDTETGLYYLQSRYYDPQTGRFINADMLVSTGQGVLGSNMFAYCLNNPVSGVDSEGTCFLSAIAGAIIGGAVAGAITAAVSCIVEKVIFKAELSIWDVVGRVALGAAEGAISGMIGLDVVKQSVKVIGSLAVGLVEGYIAYNQTEGTKEEKLHNGLLSMGVAAITMYAGAIVKPGLGETAKAAFERNVRYSTKFGLFGVGGVETYRAINKLQIRSNKDSIHNKYDEMRPQYRRLQRMLEYN